MSPEQFVAEVSPRVRDLGWVYYFTEETGERAKELGLDGFRFYFLGRGGVLGDVEPVVVSSAFGYFKPSLVQTMWDTGRQKVQPRDAGRAHFECAARFGRDHFASVDGLEEFCAAAGAVNDAADPTALSLYSGFKAEPLAEDLPGRAMQLVAVLRELRGSAHLLALRAMGLEARTAHHIARPDDAAMFGWAPEDAPSITDEDRTRLREAESLTDRLVLPAYSVLDEAGQRAFRSGLDGMEAVLAAEPRD